MSIRSEKFSFGVNAPGLKLFGEAAHSAPTAAHATGHSATMPQKAVPPKKAKGTRGGRVRRPSAAAQRALDVPQQKAMGCHPLPQL